jgi:hypothetical protein
MGRLVKIDASQSILDHCRSLAANHPKKSAVRNLENLEPRD